ncbi:hypothetical protein B0H13DRAFT_2238637 [Mycena leptocephala]|nr:hypothetical protein B0H13DRAFT_2238637 [Mycena leptocephala]
MTPSRGPRTLYDKIWDDHAVTGHNNELTLVYIDWCDLFPGTAISFTTSPQAFDGLRAAGRTVRRPDCTLATVDHNVPSLIRDPESRAQCAALERNVKEFGLAYFGLQNKRQGIVHVVGPEQGFTLPGITCVCGDSHTSTHGAFGALAFGIGTSEVEHVLATQTILQKKSRNMWITVDGELFEGADSKDVILHIIGVIGAAGGNGCVIEYSGSVIPRMTVCNMSIEAGSRAGMIAPDDITFTYLKNRPLAPQGQAWDRDTGALSNLTKARHSGTVPHPAAFSNPDRRRAAERSLEYMDLLPGTPMEDVKIDNVFIGSCTNGRIEDLRSAANIVLAAGANAAVSPSVYAMVVPGSSLVKRQAEAEAGCSMCVGLNEDQLSPGKRCATPAIGILKDDKSSRLVDLDTLSSVPQLVDRGPETFPVSPSVIQQPTAPQAPSGTPKIFRVLKGIAAPMYIENIDCAQTILNDANTGAHLAFVLDRAPYNEATILISTRKNFGCGSSREHAAWSLNDFGIQCITAPSFGEIFRNNCFQNCMLPVELAVEECSALANDAEAGMDFAVDLEQQEITRGSHPPIHFTTDPFRRTCLLNGSDDIANMMSEIAAIGNFEPRRSQLCPWSDGINVDIKIKVESSGTSAMEW